MRLLDSPDFVNTTLDHWIKDSYEDIACPDQFYPMSERFLSPGKKEHMPVKGGQQLKYLVSVEDPGTYAHAGLRDKNSPVIIDQTKVANIPWSSHKVSMSWDSEEDEMQGSDEEILDELLVKTKSMWNDLYKGFEYDSWGVPTSTTEDPTVLYGIPAWVPKCTNSAANKPFGFNGLDISGFSTGMGGISSTTYENVRSGTFIYDDPGIMDLGAKMDQALEWCHFEPPRDYKSILDKGPRWTIETDFALQQAIRLLQTGMNDNVGFDMGKWMTECFYKRIPVYWNPPLSRAASPKYDVQHPVRGIDWNSMKFFYKKNRFNQPDKAKLVGEYSHLWTVQMKNWCQLAGVDRRRNWCGYTSTWNQ